MKYYQISLILTFVLVIFEIFTLTLICLGFAAGTLCVAYRPGLAAQPA